MEEAAFLQELKEINLLFQASAILDWDNQTGMPETASEARSEVEGYLAKLHFEKSVGPKIQEALSYFALHQGELSEIGQASYHLVKKDYDLNHAIPAELMTEVVKAQSKAHTAWRNARAAKDFAPFQEALAQNIRLTKQLIPYWKKTESTDYDVLLNRYEPEMTVQKLDQVFEVLRKGIMAIRQKIQEEGIEPDTSFINRKLTKKQQRKFAVGVVEQLGFDFSRGRLDDTIHPFMTGINHNDARITTRWDEEDFTMAIFGILHEAGHGLYEQNIASKYEYTPVHQGTSMGIHESQSLFNEIIIGSNRTFWEKQYPFFKECSEGTFDDIDFETFYKGLKKTKASLIRIEADSLTYPLHIIIRYEIEKLLFNEELPVEKLPLVWKQKYEEYLGITPADDLEGILQDVHWSGNMFGYFPSYALGYMYAAQLYQAMNKEFSVDAILASDDYSVIRLWLTEHIHRYGASKEPKELMFSATGEELNPVHLLNYLQAVYYTAYGIKD